VKTLFKLRHFKSSLTSFVMMITSLFCHPSFQKMVFDSSAWEALLGNTLQGQDGKTIDVAEALKEKDCIGLYFSAHWCPPCRGFTPQLAELYKELTGSKGKNFEIVFVSSDKDDEQFKSYFNEMPWLALPFSDRDRKQSLSSKFKVGGIPTLVLLNADGTVITTKGRAVVSNIENYPWIPKTFHEIMGLEDGGSTTLVNAAGESKLTKDVLADVDVIGLYFSAHWCPPCRGFTPQLAEKYKALKEAGKSVEVVFVSGDKGPEEFKEYLGEMPWWAVPIEQKGSIEELNNLFEHRGIPHLVFVEKSTGKLITNNGRAAVSVETFIEDFPYHPKPVNDLSVTADGINEYPSLVVLLNKAPAEQRESILAAFNEIGEEAFKQKEDQRVVGRFFTVKEGGDIAGRLRGMCNLEEKDEAQLLLVDIPDNGGFYLSSEKDLSKEAMTAFIDGYKTKSITRGQMS